MQYLRACWRLVIGIVVVLVVAVVVVAVSQDPVIYVVLNNSTREWPDVPITKLRGVTINRHPVVTWTVLVSGDNSFQV